MQRRRLHRTKARCVPLCLGRRCSHLAIPSARSLACEIMRPGGRGHMRDCGTGDGRGLPETTGRTRVGKLRSCRIHGSQPLATGDPHALRSRDARHRPGQRFGTSAQCDQHASCSRRSGRKARTRRPWASASPGACKQGASRACCLFRTVRGEQADIFSTQLFGLRLPQGKNTRTRQKLSQRQQQQASKQARRKASSGKGGGPHARRDADAVAGCLVCCLRRPTAHVGRHSSKLV